MTIREATEQDTARLVEMATHFMKATAYGDLFVPDPVRLAAQVAMCFRYGVIVVAEDKGGVIAAMIAVLGVTYDTNPCTTAEYAEEQAWWVEPEYRSGTVGPRLLNHVREWARARGLAFLKMGAPQNAPAVGAFYERLGGRPVETAFVFEL
jgi:GNAT superfamily N-acetyltransferase